MSKDIVKLYLLEYFRKQMNFSNQTQSDCRSYIKNTFANTLCKKCGLVTTSKLPLYCTQKVCNYYPS